MENNRNCTICETPVKINFCEKCGQKKGDKESTILSLITDVFSSIFSLQNSVPKTFLTLLTAPNKIIDNYAEGHRGYYPSPGKMILFAFAIAAVHTLTVSEDLLGTNITVQNDQNSGHIVLLFITIILITGTSYLTFIRSKMKFAKHIISTLYLWSAFFTIFLIASDLFLLLFDLDFSDILLASMFTSILIWNTIVFTRKKKPLIILGNLAIHLLLIAIIIPLLILIIKLTGTIEY
jgi:hypothetical protein